jgi:hypothetical protein
MASLRAPARFLTKILDENTWVANLPRVENLDDITLAVNCCDIVFDMEMILCGRFANVKVLAIDLRPANILPANAFVVSCCDAVRAIPKRFLTATLFANA